MLQIIIESQELEVGRDNGSAYADFLNEDGYLVCAVNLQYYSGPIASWAKDANVVLCYPEEIGKIFSDESEPGFGCRIFDWKDYCKFVNTNVAA